MLQALSRTPIGHLDPLYVELMSEVQELLRYAWQTDNRLTLPMSGTGSAAMEATLANTIEPGDTVLVAVKGYFGHRLSDMAGRYRADVRVIERPWGEAFSLEELEAALIEHAAVSEAATIGVPDELKGTELVCFVVLHGGTEESESLRAALVGQVVEALGKVDRPRAILFVDDLPKTRSAKIVRRLIQRAHLGEEDLGDLASVANPEALEAIRRAR